MFLDDMSTLRAEEIVTCIINYFKARNMQIDAKTKKYLHELVRHELNQAESRGYENGMRIGREMDKY